MFWLTVGYVNVTLITNSGRAELEIGTDGSTQTGQLLRVDGYGYGFSLPRGTSSGIRMGLGATRTIIPVRPQTPGRLAGPIANTSIDSRPWGRMSYNRLADPINLRNSNYIRFCYCSSVECIEFLMQQPAFSERMSYAPAKEYNAAMERTYSDVESSIWW